METTIEEARIRHFTIDGAGSFTLHRPTNGDKVAMSRKVTQLTEGVPLFDLDPSLLVRAAAALDVLADERPDGFSSKTVMDSYEEEPYFVFWGAYQEWLNSFRQAGTPAAG